jgi:hypothetical protein
VDNQERKAQRSGDVVRTAMLALRKGEGRVIDGVIFPRCAATGCDHGSKEDCFPSEYMGKEFWASPSCYFANAVCGYCSQGHFDKRPHAHGNCVNRRPIETDTNAYLAGIEQHWCACLCSKGGEVE